MTDVPESNKTEDKQPKSVASDLARHPSIDLRRSSNWQEQPEVTFDQSATLHIARWVMVIFGGVYVLSFVLGFAGIFVEGATFDKLIEFAKLMITSVMPIATLAVGYYLGQSSRASE